MYLNTSDFGWTLSSPSNQTHIPGFPTDQSFLISSQEKNNFSTDIQKNLLNNQNSLCRFVLRCSDRTHHCLMYDTLPELASS